jgi:glucokinase
MKESTEICMGVDIGGTKVAAGLVTNRGEILFKTRTAMNARGSAEEALAAVRTAIDEVLRRNPDAKVSGIGLSSPGPVDPQSGVVINPSNLPCWRNFPLASAVREIYGLPVQLHHDSEAAAVAEALWGAGAGYRCVFYATIGTGIGTAIVFNGSVYLGRTGAAGEGGHMTIDYRGQKCRCGKSGCVEILAAGPAIAERARLKLSQPGSRDGHILKLAGGNPARISSEMVATAWREGDDLAGEVLRETADILAIWLGNVVDMLEPDVIVVGGGVSALVAAWFDRIRSQLPCWSVNSRCGEIPLVEARYGNDSGIAGAAALLQPRHAVSLG